jgi:hypothetical protein
MVIDKISEHLAKLTYYTVAWTLALWLLYGRTMQTLGWVLLAWLAVACLTWFALAVSGIVGGMIITRKVKDRAAYGVDSPSYPVKKPKDY